MAGGMKETDKEKLAQHCESFKIGVHRFFDAGPTKGDMWFFELFHHLQDCADRLRQKD